MRLRRRDAGFTLIELLLAIAILGIISVPLANVILGYLRNTDTTTARLVESRDAQISTAYFAQDVASIGTQNYTDPLNPQLKQSVETGVLFVSKDVPYGVAFNDPLYPCGVAGTPNAFLRFAWDDVTAGPSATTTLTVVAYFVMPVGTLYELHRIQCAGSTVPSSDIVLARSLSAVPVVACDGTPVCTGTGASVPKSVALTMNIHRPENRNPAVYVVTLTGQRRQT
jgi:prepilin-type N-terminal cleavage/methylation domain-containing protein